LFNPALLGDTLVNETEAWRESHMKPGPLMRIQTLQERERKVHAVLVKLPDGQTRSLEPGEASRILKGVLENWAPVRLRTAGSDRNGARLVTSILLSIVLFIPRRLTCPALMKLGPRRVCLSDRLTVISVSTINSPAPRDQLADVWLVILLHLENRIEPS
jgi:hypothetical protein